MDEECRDSSTTSRLRASWGISGKAGHQGAYESLAKVGTYVTTISGVDR